MIGLKGEKIRFGMAEAVTLLAISNMSRIFLPFPRSLVEMAGQAAWISALGGFALSMAQVLVLSSLIRPVRNKTLVEITEDGLGPVAGTFFNMFYALILFLSVAELGRSYSEALIISALPRAPLVVALMGFTVTSLLGAHLGLEAIARSVRLTYPFVIGGMAVLLLSLVPFWNLNNLFPVLGNGAAGIFKGAFYSGFIVEVLIALIIFESFHGVDMVGKVASRALVIGFGFLSMLLLVMILASGYRLAQEYTLPFYEMARLIYLGRFFQRVESLFIIIWGFIGMIKLAFSLYVSAFVLARSLKLPDYRPVIWPLSLAAFSLAMVPSDMLSAERITLVTRNFGWIPAFVLPLTALLVYRFKNKNSGESRK